MKKLVFLIYFISIKFAVASSNVVYLDVQYIIDQSELGIFYKKKLNVIKESNQSGLIKKEKEIKKYENEIKNKKNILKKEEIDNEILKLNKIIKEYQVERKNKNQLFLDEKKKYTSKILNIINPLLTKYVETNKIDLVIEKKNILIGIKTLDITNQILILLNEETQKKKLINEN